MDQSKTTVNIVWDGDKSGNGNVDAGFLKTQIAIPKVFGGNGEGTEPKELLITSAASCYLMTLVSLLEARRLTIDGLSMNSQASVSKEEGLKITHFPKIVLPAGATEDKIQLANQTIESADRNCDVGNLLKKAGAYIEIKGEVYTS